MKKLLLAFIIAATMAGCTQQAPASKPDSTGNTAPPIVEYSNP